MHFLEHEQAQHSPVGLCIYAALGDHVQTDKRLPCTKIIYLHHKPNHRLPITVALTKPLTEDNFYWLPRILLLRLGWFRSTPISISIPATSVFLPGRIREQCNYWLPSCVRGVLLMIVSIGLMPTQLMRPVTERAVVSLRRATCRGGKAHHHIVTCGQFPEPPSAKWEHKIVLYWGVKRIWNI